MAYSEETRRVILKMREILSGPEDWTQRFYWRSRKTGKPLKGFVRSNPACCLLGAQQVAMGKKGFDPISEQVLTDCAGTRDIIGYNDSHKWEDIDALLNCAVAKVTEKV